jgi:hypothetical protein
MLHPVGGFYNPTMLIIGNLISIVLVDLIMLYSTTVPYPDLHPVGSFPNLIAVPATPTNSHLH